MRRRAGRRIACRAARSTSGRRGRSCTPTRGRARRPPPRPRASGRIAPCSGSRRRAQRRQSPATFVGTCAKNAWKMGWRLESRSGARSATRRSNGTSWCATASSTRLPDFARRRLRKDGAPPRSARSTTVLAKSPTLRVQLDRSRAADVDADDDRLLARVAVEQHVVGREEPLRRASPLRRGRRPGSRRRRTPARGYGASRPRGSGAAGLGRSVGSSRRGGDAGEPIAPVDELLFDHRVGEAPPFSACVILGLNVGCSELRVLAGDEAVVEFRQFVEDDDVRPPVADDVVEDELEDVIGLGETAAATRARVGRSRDRTVLRRVNRLPAAQRASGSGSVLRSRRSRSKRGSSETTR